MRALALLATLSAGCATASSSGPPAAAPEDCPAVAAVDAEGAPCAKCEECPKCLTRRRRASNVAPEATGAAHTCVIGLVQTAGDMVLPVKRVLVRVVADGAQVGTTTTDDSGRFVWCTPPGPVKTGAKVVVYTEKDPFLHAQKVVTWKNGLHQRVSYALEAPGLTDGGG